MNLIQLVLLVALVAVVVALFAWAHATPQNAKSDRRPWASSGLRRLWFALYLVPIAIERLFLRLGFARAARGGVQFANIGEGTFEHGVKSYLPDATTAARYLCYKIGTDGDHVALAGAGDVPIGQSDDQADAGVPLAINLFGGKTGMLRVITDGSIGNGDYVKTAANGQVTKSNTGDAGQFGRALFGTDTSSGAGDTITVVHTVPSKLAF